MENSHKHENSVCVFLMVILISDNMKDSSIYKCRLEVICYNLRAAENNF